MHEGLSNLNGTSWRNFHSAYGFFYSFLCGFPQRNDVQYSPHPKYSNAVKIHAIEFLNFSCKSNCRRNIDPESRLSLVGICADCGRYLQYKWELLSRDTFVKIPVRWMTDTLTSQHSVSLVLLPFWLTKAKEYLARFTVTTPSGMIPI